MSAIARLLSIIWRKPPPTPALEEAGNSTDPKETSVAHDIFHFTGKDVRTAAQGLKELASGEPIDDRQLLLEHGIELLQGLPSNSGLGERLADGFIGLLWNDLQHPPRVTLDTAARFHAPDGSGNDWQIPDSGKAGSPYGRTVPPVAPQSPYLPDPDLVFDELLKRPKDSPFIEHPSGLNRLFFAFANIVIHECFQSDKARPWINKTSSYVELSTVYGDSQQEQDAVRTKVMGRLHPDTVSNKRIMMMPPPTIALLLLFSRHHNYLAERLYEVNEEGKFKPWEELDEAGREWQDNELFNLARNINVAWFAQCVLHDYVAAILNTVRSPHPDWHLELGKDIREIGGKRLDRAASNVVAIEFKYVYHWHAALSAADDHWMQDLIREHYPDQNVDEITLEDFTSIAEQLQDRLDKTSPAEWTFGGLSRDKSGRFPDEALSSILKDAIEEPAHAFGARSTPSCLKVIEVLSQLQARKVHKVATMNEFRRYLHLKPFESFSEWNPDPEIAATAEKLYGDIEHLELYIGLQAEECKPSIAGSGLCPGQTLARGVLNDAVALIRGDRFLSADLNITTLTSWGMAQLSTTHGFLTQTLYRGLPRSWGRYSRYAYFAFYTPKAIAQVLEKHKQADLYDAERPFDVYKQFGLHSFDACKAAFENREVFRVAYYANLGFLTDKGFAMLAYDDHQNHDPRKEYMTEAFFEDRFVTNVRSWYSHKTRAHLTKYSFFYGNRAKAQINIARDVFNRIPIVWLAERYGIPLKTQDSPGGLLTVTQLFQALLVLFVFGSFDQIPHASFMLREAVMRVGPVVRGIFKTRLETIDGGIGEKLTSMITRNTSFRASKAADRMYESINRAKIPHDKAIGDLLLTISAAAGNLTQQTTILLDLFLRTEYEYAKARLSELAVREDEAAFKEFEMWVWEGMRIAGVVPGLPRIAAKDIVIDDGEHGILHIGAGDTVILVTSKAHLDPKHFPDPYRLDPTRDRKSYILLGHGMHFCFGARLVAPSIVSMLREVFKLKNLRRAKGRAGHLNATHEDLGHLGDACRIQLYLDSHCKESPIPTSFIVEYDM